MAEAEERGGAGRALVAAGIARHEARHRVRHDGWTGEKQRLFLETLAKAGNVRDACRAAGMSNTSAYRLRRIDPAFGQGWDAALRRASTSLEAVAFARAVEGVEEVVIRDGKEAYRKRRFSDGLLRLLLQASNPDKYGRTGGQSSVQAREAVEARIEEIEQNAYRAAWRALVAEYNYGCEPEVIRQWLLRKFSVMHSRMCGNAVCRECHPERVPEGPRGTSSYYDPDDDHQPITPSQAWMQMTLSEMREERIRANLAGEEPRIDIERVPHKVGKGVWQTPPPPYWAGSAAEAEEAGRGDADPSPHGAGGG